jgi:hypothetical protein
MRKTSMVGSPQGHGCETKFLLPGVGRGPLYPSRPSHKVMPAGVWPRHTGVEAEGGADGLVLGHKAIALLCLGPLT